MADKILLIIEKSKDGLLWGRVTYDNNLIVEKAKGVETLERRFKKLLKGFHGLDPDTIQFDLAYDLTTLFEYKDYLNISAIAEKAGINPSLMRQYAAGIKFPSEEKTRQIENTIHQLGRELLTTKVRTSRTNRTKPKPGNRKKN